MHAMLRSLGPVRAACLPASCHRTAAHGRKTILASTWHFSRSLLAIVPLAERIGYATEQLAMHVGEFAAGLINTTLGNVPELIVTCVALAKSQPTIALDSLVGGVLSNLLLVSGLSLFAGGLRRRVQIFNTILSSTLISILFLSALVFVLSSAVPAAYEHVTLTSVKPMVVRRVEVLSRPATNVSRMLAVAEMALYALFLVFSLRTHSNLFNGGEQEKRNDQGECNAQEKMTSSKAAAAAAAANAESGDEDPEVASINRAYMSREFANKKEEEEEDEVVLGTRASLFWLTILAALISWVSNGLVDSIEGAAKKSGMCQLFITAIILPNVNNAPEHAVAIRLGIKDKADLVLSIALGSAAQLGLLLLPAAVILDWFNGGTLNFRIRSVEYQAYVFGVLLAALLLHSGRSTWMLGLTLIIGYVVISCAWFYAPETQDDFCVSCVTVSGPKGEHIHVQQWVETLPHLLTYHYRRATAADLRDNSSLRRDFAQGIELLIAADPWHWQPQDAFPDVGGAMSMKSLVPPD